MGALISSLATHTAGQKKKEEEEEARPPTPHYDQGREYFTTRLPTMTDEEWHMSPMSMQTYRMPRLVNGGRMTAERVLRLPSESEVAASLKE